VTSGALILIVEDNPRNLKLARDVLEYVGHRILTADTAEAGIEFARSEQPRLILMDIQLPGMDGIQALARLQAHPATSSIPVVALTAFAMKDDRERFLAAGFAGYLEKPISVPAFPGQIEQLLATTSAEAQT
jgi:two-component system cell cycle response regulator DivK